MLPLRSILRLRSIRTSLSLGVFLIAGVLAPSPEPLAAQLSDEHRTRGLEMLEQLEEDLRDHYYDPDFRGLDLDAKVAEADSAIRAAGSDAEMLAALAQFMANLGDSHTAFYPPSTVHRIRYGFDMGFVGDTCYIRWVDDEGPAAGTGVEVGDAVLALDVFKPTRESFWMVRYLYYVLSPRPKVQLTLRKPDGERAVVVVDAAIERGPPVLDSENPYLRRMVEAAYRRQEEASRHRWKVVADSVFLWRIPVFDDDGRDAVDDVVEEARGHGVMILDLRSNPGGRIRTLTHFLGAFYERKVPVGSVRRRDGSEVLWVEPITDAPYRGRVIVLTDAATASAAEIAAHALRMDGHATVVGDRSAGQVMAAVVERHKVGGFNRFWEYAASITVYDIIMADGERLEGEGVTPDVTVLPTGAQMATGEDPVLAKALELAGIGAGEPVDPAAVWAGAAEVR